MCLCSLDLKHLREALCGHLLSHRKYPCPQGLGGNVFHYTMWPVTTYPFSLPETSNGNYAPITVAAVTSYLTTSPENEHHLSEWYHNNTT